MGRLQSARVWVLIVFTYYMIRAGLVIYPKYDSVTPLIKILVIVQSFLCICLIVLTAITFKVERSIELIQWILYGQSIMLSLSNFNGYDESDTQNFQGLNMISTVFSVIFAIFNSYLGLLTTNDMNQKKFMTAITIGFMMFTVMQTNFIWQDMTFHTVTSIIICLIFTFVLVVSFIYISNSILE